MRKGIITAVAVLVLIVLVLFMYGYLRVHRSLPVRSGTLHFDGLQDSVEITFDRMGIPQIWAVSETDGYFALGSLHASDRLFQMDMTRRVAQGRLSELFGKSTLELDRLQRKIGHHRLADEQMHLISDESRNRLQAYSDGVNAWVEQSSALPFEYALLRKDFEPWSVADIVCILSFQTWYSDFLQNPDQTYLEIMEKVGPERALELIRDYPDRAPFTVPQQTDPVTLSGRFRNQMAEILLGFAGLPFQMSTASNSWILSPERTESGAAILASDPHLEIARLPQFWHMAGLHIEETGLDALGIMTPGLPFIVMGHNGRAAWAFTVGGIDVTEYYLEEINPRDSTQYRTPQGWNRFVEFTEVIEVDGEPDDTLEVRLTRNGPVLVENDSLGTTYSFHWAGFDMPLERTVDAGFRLAATEDFETFRRTVTRFGALDANWTYADVHGNIGYQLGTPVPVRPDSLGILPAPGWDQDYQWLGYRPLENTPWAYNPQRGWLATCNNKQDSAHISYDLQGYFASDRIMRISSLLREKKRFGVEDMKRYQMDQVDMYLLSWRDKLVPLLRKYDHMAAASRLEKWDGGTERSSWSTAFISEFLYHFRERTLGDEFNTSEMRISVIWLEALFDEGEVFWFDDKKTEDVTETREDIVKACVDTSVLITEGKVWGDRNKLVMNHPLSVVPMVSTLLGLEQGPWPWQGTKGALNASFVFRAEDGTFRTIVGPSWRFVIDFADPDAATFVLPCGNSGNPASPHYMNFLPLWKSGERWNVPLSYEKVRKASVSGLHLVPEKMKE